MSPGESRSLNKECHPGRVDRCARRLENVGSFVGRSEFGREKQAGHFVHKQDVDRRVTNAPGPRHCLFEQPRIRATNRVADW